MTTSPSDRADARRKAIERARKLLALASNNPSAEEAAAAMAAASRIMREHDICEREVYASTITIIEGEAVVTYAAVPKWVHIVAMASAIPAGVEYYIATALQPSGKRESVRFCGTASGVEIAHYYFTFLVGVIERGVKARCDELLARAVSKMGHIHKDHHHDIKQHMRKELSKRRDKFRVSMACGIIDAVKTQFQIERDNAPESEHAITLAVDDAIARHLDAAGCTTRNFKSTKIDSAMYDEGRRVSLRAGLNASPSNPATKALPPAR